MVNILYVTANQCLFGIDLTYIKKILQLSELQVLPHAPEYVAGLLNYQGDLIPVYDLSILIGINRNEKYTLNTIIIICSSGDKLGGLIVDGIHDLEAVANGDNTSSKQIECDKTFISQIANLNNRSVIFPDMQKLLTQAIKLTEGEHDYK